MKAARLFAALALIPAAAATAGTTYPPIREIVFAGNATTQPDVLLRELVVHVGDPADPVRLERSRQAIQDLRLFSSVELEETAQADGVRLLIRLHEKRYVLPLPRASMNSDGQYSYGVGMRWWNVFGLNHTLHLTLAQGSRQEANRGSLQQLHLSYDIPFLSRSPYGLGVDYTHTEEPVTGALFDTEITDSGRWLLTRAFGDGPASHGWRLGGGVQWQDQRRPGLEPPDAPGQATALVANANYNEARFNIYSEQGLRFDLEARATVDRIASDYRYRELLGNYEQSWPVGDAPHQTFGLFAEAGIYDGGPSGVPPPFALGGSDNLRGYPLRFQRGDGYAYGGVEFLRPLHWDWLRGVVFLEAGETWGAGGEPGPDGVFADVGIGLRLRLNSFVRTEFNIGLAFPLVDAGDGGSERVFATGHH